MEREIDQHETEELTAEELQTIVCEEHAATVQFMAPDAVIMEPVMEEVPEVVVRCELHPMLRRLTRRHRSLRMSRRILSRIANPMLCLRRLLRLYSLHFPKNASQRGLSQLPRRSGATLLSS